MKQMAIIILLIIGAMASGLSQKANDKKQKNNDTTFPAIVILKEPRFLLNIHTGYSYGLGSTFRFYPDQIRVVSVYQPAGGPEQKTITYRDPWKSLGDGFRIGGGISFIANDFINIGIDADYFTSPINKLRDSSYREIKDSPQPGEADDYSYKEHLSLSYKATLFTITPNITFKAISKPNWFIYNKLGAVVTVSPNGMETDANDIRIRQGVQGVFSDSSSTEVKKYDWIIKKPAVGFMGAFGIQLKLAKKLRAFGELQFSHIVFIVNRKSLTEFLVNGKDMTNTLSVSSRELEFVKTYTTNTSDNNPNIPSKTLEQKIPISSVGGQVGLAFQF
ncbi:MAG: hypothetical protein JWP81_3955 [Ferruginibacter sp.]|nr:hypothetical protein [Ferruginibacter sp.]